MADENDHRALPPIPDGVTLVNLLEELVARFGWERLGEEVPIQCFLNNPSIKSSLTFLRRTPWARTRVEGLYRREIVAVSR